MRSVSYKAISKLFTLGALTPESSNDPSKKEEKRIHAQCDCIKANREYYGVCDIQPCKEGLLTTMVPTKANGDECVFCKHTVYWGPLNHAQLAAKRKRTKKAKPVEAFDRRTGKTYRYNSIVEAVQTTGIKRIARAIETGHSAGGMKWKYAG